MHRVKLAEITLNLIECKYVNFKVPSKDELLNIFNGFTISSLLLLQTGTCYEAVNIVNVYAYANILSRELSITIEQAGAILMYFAYNELDVTNRLINGKDNK
jgi:hypothetical protein